MKRPSDGVDLIKGIFFYIMNTEEIWKDVEGYEGLYQISNFGRVMSIKAERKVLKLQVNRYGYTNVMLHCKEKSEAFAIHKLVAVAFMGFDKSKKAILVKHKDFNMKNNHVDNLLISESIAGSKKDGVVKDRETGIFVTTIVLAGKTIYRQEFQTMQSANKAYRQNILKFINELREKGDNSFHQNKNSNKRKMYGFS